MTEKKITEVLDLEYLNSIIEDDKEFEDIFKEIQYIKNRIRSHIRKNYRIEYEKMKNN